MSATLLIDTRQQEGKHTLKHDWFKAHGFRLVRTKLYVGDYQLVGGTRTVDTKEHILELASNIDQQHERFRRELINARDAGFQLTILVENEDGVTDLATLSTWVNPRNAINRRKGLKPPIDGERMAKACATMQTKYGVRFEFCKPEEAGARVIEILENGGKADADTA